MFIDSFYFWSCQLHPIVYNFRIKISRIKSRLCSTKWKVERMSFVVAGCCCWFSIQFLVWNCIWAHVYNDQLKCYANTERKKNDKSNKKTAVVFSKAFSVIDVISAVTFTKRALIYIALSPNGFESSTINGFPTTTTTKQKKKECLLSFLCVSLLVWVLV